jgi:hypothetical protein
MVKVLGGSCDDHLGYVIPKELGGHGNLANIIPLSKNALENF